MHILTNSAKLYFDSAQDLESFRLKYFIPADWIESVKVLICPPWLNRIDLDKPPIFRMEHAKS